MLDTLIKKLPSTYKLSKNNTNKFLLLLRKGVYPYEHMNDWNKSNETKLPSIKDHYNNLQLKNITKEDYDHAK